MDMTRLTSWLRTQRSNIVSTVVILIAVAFMATRNDVLFLENHRQHDWQQIEDVSDYQKRLLIQVLRVSRPAQTTAFDWVRLQDMSNSFVYRLDYDESLAQFLEIQTVISSLSKAYPEATQPEAFSRLLTLLRETQFEASILIQTYNGTVSLYNTSVAAFPQRYFANYYGLLPLSSLSFSDSVDTVSVESI